MMFFLCRTVLERPSSQMSYLDHFLKETSTRHGGSVESEEGDIEDNRAPSIASSKSNLSELSIVSKPDTNSVYKLIFINLPKIGFCDVLYKDC